MSPSRTYFPLALELLHSKPESGIMDAFVITAALFGSFAGAFILQKAALEGLLRIMQMQRRARQ